MRPSRVVVTVIAWGVVVALASSLVWAVISRAGTQVMSPEPLVGAPQQASPRTRPTDATAPAPASAPRRTWQDLGMLLVAECDGAAIRQVSASPADGYAVETKDAGPDELEVEFEGREDAEGASVTVTARCVGGVPEFTSATEDEDEDED